MVTDAERAFLELPGFAHLATLGPDGSPQLTTMWHRWGGDTLRMVAPASATKAHNLSADPRVSVIIDHPSNGYSYLELRGEARLLRDDAAARAELRLIAARYIGDDANAFVEGLSSEPRVLIAIHPRRVINHLGGTRPRPVQES